MRYFPYGKRFKIQENQANEFCRMTAQDFFVLGECSIEFSMVDIGIGIQEDRLDLIFHAFQQVDASTTRTRRHWP